MSDLLSSAVFAAGGGLGAVARHAIALALPHRFPWSTLVVNVAGSLVLGVLAGSLTSGDQMIGAEGQRLLAGFCGGFTTFSSFAYQSLDLRHTHSAVHVAGNIVLNLGLCLLAFAAGAVV